MKITNRQNEILFHIIGQYIETSTPVGSKTILTKFMPNISAATIRNDMLKLEKLGFLEKVHNSSGRVPSIKAYKLYESSIDNLWVDEDLIKQLEIIFSKRNISINKIIEESTSLISSFLNLPMVITEIGESELLKGVSLTQISENSAIIIVITSIGGVHKNIIDFKEQLDLIDVSVCVKIFNDHLIDTKMSELLNKIIDLKPIILKKVKNYERAMQDIISKIFNTNPAFKFNVKGQSELLLQPEFNDKQNLKSIITLLEKTSIWQQLAFDQAQKGLGTRVIFGEEIGEKNISIASTLISTGDTISQISVVGPVRMDYTNAKAILEFIRKGLSKIWKK